MHLTVINEERKIFVSNSIFNRNYNANLIHQVIVSYASGSRQGSAAQKNRAEVSGSNKKPWRQKGTGRARAGSRKSPIWRTGGVTFAGKPQDYSKKINKKMYRNALKIIFSELLRQNRLFIITRFFLQKPKTKLLIKKIKELFFDEILLIDTIIDQNIFLASRNLYKVNVISINNINPIDLINHKNIALTTDALHHIEEMLI